MATTYLGWSSPWEWLKNGMEPKPGWNVVGDKLNNFFNLGSGSIPQEAITLPITAISGPGAALVTGLATKGSSKGGSNGKKSKKKANKKAKTSRIRRKKSTVSSKSKPKKQSHKGKKPKRKQK